MFGKEAKKVLIRLFIAPIVSLMILSGCSSNDGLEDTYAYSLMFEFPKHGINWMTGRLDKINLRTLELEQSYKVDSAVNNITVHNDRVFLSYHRDDGRYLRKITEFFPKIGIEKKIIETIGSGPKEIVPVKDKLYVRVDTSKRIESIEKNNNKSRSQYQRSGYEIYSNTKKPEYLGSILLGEHDFIESWDIRGTNFYVAIRPYSVSDDRYKSGGRYNAFGDSFVVVIDTEKSKVKDRIEVSDKLRNIKSIKHIGEKLYITAANASDYDGGLHGDNHFKHVYEKENPNKSYKRKKSFKRSSFPGIVVFDKDFNLVDEISVPPRVDGLIYDPNNNYLIVEHKPLWLVTKTGYMSIVDLSEGKVLKTFRVPKYKMMSLVSKDTLLISSENGLFIFDTKQLGVIKEFPGYYAPISMNYSPKRLEIEREGTFPVIDSSITELTSEDLANEFKARKLSRPVKR